MGDGLIAAGSFLVIAAVLFDLFIRLRMFITVGDKTVFRRDRGFIYADYRSAAGRHNWAQWPVDAMWALLAVGVSFFVVGVVLVNRGTG